MIPPFDSMLEAIQADPAYPIPEVLLVEDQQFTDYLDYLASMLQMENPVPTIGYFDEFFDYSLAVSDVVISVVARLYGSAAAAESVAVAHAKKFQAVAHDARGLLSTDGEVPETSEARAREAARAAERAAGVTAQGRLAANFDSIAGAESKLAFVFQALGVVSLLGGSILAFVLLLDVDQDSVGVKEIVTKALVSIPGFVLFFYFTAEATQHRAHSRWARQIAVQLDTVDAFTESLSTQASSEIVLQLGRSVFRGADPFDSRQPISESDVPAAVRLAKDLIQLANAGGSSTPKY